MPYSLTPKIPSVVCEPRMLGDKRPPSAYPGRLGVPPTTPPVARCSLTKIDLIVVVTDDGIDLMRDKTESSFEIASVVFAVTFGSVF